MNATIDLIVLIVFGTSVLMLVAVLARALPRIRSIDENTIVAAQSEAVKERLIARRIRRKILSASSWIEVKTAPVQQKVKTRFRTIIAALERLETRYRTKAETLKPLDDTAAQAKLAALLAEAVTARKEQDYPKAERLSIEAIGLAPNDAEAYRNLGELYLEKKDFPHAIETLRHALKLAPDNAELYLALAAINREMGAYKTALERCQQAVELQPNDPKSLDALIEVSILVKDRALAERTLERLESVNPENQKLADFRERILELPKNFHAPVKKPAPPAD